jgi:hypothetical protein
LFSFLLSFQLVAPLSFHLDAPLSERAPVMPVTTFARTFLYAYTITVTLATLGVAAAFIHQISEQFYGSVLSPVSPSVSTELKSSSSRIRRYYEPSAELLAASVILVLTLPILFVYLSFRESIRWL